MKLRRLLRGLFLLLTACARPGLDALTVPRPVYSVGYEETGRAALYGRAGPVQRAAHGEVYDMSQMTAAHPALPLGSSVIVESLLNGRTAEVRITDRGPSENDRSLVLSQPAARALGTVVPGMIPVRLCVVALPGSPTKSRSGKFSVQVASFTSEYRAAVLKDILNQERASARVQPGEAGGQTFYRVRVGTYASRREARRQALRLAAAGYPVVIIEE